MRVLCVFRQEPCIGRVFRTHFLPVCGCLPSPDGVSRRAGILSFSETPFASSLSWGRALGVVPKKPSLSPRSPGFSGVSPWRRCRVLHFAPQSAVHAEAISEKGVRSALRHVLMRVGVRWPRHHVGTTVSVPVSGISPLSALLGVPALGSLPPPPIPASSLVGAAPTHFLPRPLSVESGSRVESPPSHPRSSPALSWGSPSTQDPLVTPCRYPEGAAPGPHGKDRRSHGKGRRPGHGGSLPTRLVFGVFVVPVTPASCVFRWIHNRVWGCKCVLLGSHPGVGVRVCKTCSPLACRRAADFRARSLRPTTLLRSWFVAGLVPWQHRMPARWPSL